MGPARPGAGGASHWTRNSAGLPACPNAPPISLLVLPKEKRAVHGPKRKNALERSVPLRDGGRREMVPADSRWLSDRRGGVPQRLDSGFPRRGCGGQRGARTHLTSFSFRAFRFATRSPGHSQRLLRWLFAGALIDHRPAAAKRGAGCIPDFPGPKVSPRVGRFRP